MIDGNLQTASTKSNLTRLENQVVHVYDALIIRVIKIKI